MITKLRAENFKSWKDTGELQLAPLTGLFGTNSSGKSSILQILLMLKQTAESSDRNRVLNTNNDLVNLGTFYDLIYNHDLNKKLHISFSWKLKNPFIIDHEGLPKKAIHQLSYDSVIHNELDRIVVDNFLYEVHPYSFRFGICRNEKDKDLYNLIHDSYDAKRIDGQTKLLPSPVKCYGFPNEAIGYYQNTGFLPSFTLAFENLFSQIRYLGPLREYPRRFYPWSGEIPLNVGISGEKSISALLASRNLGAPIDERVKKWMKKTRLLESFNLKPISEERKDLYEIEVKINNMATKVSITDVGFGVSQLLPVLVLCYYVPKGSIILLEHPEIHLHPSAQADLADVLIDVVKYRNVQIIVESHSEHLLRRLQRRIAEEAIPSDKVNLYFCRMENGASQIEKLQLDDDGYINNWPPNFFGDEMGDLIAMTEATMKKKGITI